MIDTHAHIFLSQFSEDLPEVISRAKNEGVELILMPNIDSTTIDAMKRTEEQYPDICRSMIGLHPCYVKEGYREDLKWVEKELETGNYVAVGEIGTDLYWDKSFWKEQQDAFIHQLNLAKKYKLPVAIHCRESIEETIAMVDENNSDDLSGVFHCFSGTLAQAEKITRMGFYLGIGGVSTFKNGGLGEVLENIPLEFLVLETDSPYLAPTPYRGKRNEPFYIKEIARKIAEVKNLSLGEVVKATSENSRRLFNL